MNPHIDDLEPIFDNGFLTVYEDDKGGILLVVADAFENTATYLDRAQKENLRKALDW